MPDSSEIPSADQYEGIPPEFVVLAMEKVSQRFQFCDLNDPIVQTIQQMSLNREATNLMKGESLPW
ncbi:MAG: hypothetical protein V4507_06130 [Verrucomicrobiota bacterium]